jgi:hypothetical protein
LRGHPKKYSTGDIISFKFFLTVVILKYYIFCFQFKLIRWHAFINQSSTACCPFAPRGGAPSASSASLIGSATAASSNGKAGRAGSTASSPGDAGPAASSQQRQHDHQAAGQDGPPTAHPSNSGMVARKNLFLSPINQHDNS